MPQQPADSHDMIRVQGARENNLQNIDVELPKRRLTVFTGVSGSGKSSLVFGTVAAESQRLINETYSAFLQGFMPSLARPDVEFKLSHGDRELLSTHAGERKTRVRDLLGRVADGLVPVDWTDGRVTVTGFGVTIISAAGSV